MSQEKKEKIAYHFRKILETLELDLNNPSLSKTPERVAKMYVEEVFSGLDPQSYPDVTFHQDYIPNESVFIKNISLISFCEHHLVPMIGLAHVAYIPQVGVLGLSKIHRILRHFAKQPQLQERLTKEVGNNLKKTLQTDDVAVSLQMKHFCVVVRGVEDPNSVAETFFLSGRFESNPATRSEFFLRISQEDHL